MKVLKLFLLPILFFLFLNFTYAKSLEDLNFRWSKLYENGGNIEFVKETDSDIIIATSSHLLELYNKQTGEVQKYEAGADSYFEKIGDNFLVFVCEDTGNNIYVNKFILLNDKLEEIKKYELITENRYFNELTYLNNNLVLSDNYGNNYHINEELVIVPFDVYEDDSYALDIGTQIIKYDKNHKEIKRISYEKEVSTDEYSIMKYKEYFVVFYNKLAYKYTSNLYMCNYDLYLVNSDLETVDTYNDSEICNGLYMTTTYDEPYIRNPYDEYFRIDITNERISLVESDEPVSTSGNVGISQDKEDFKKIFDSEAEEGTSYYYSYEKLENNSYFVSITWITGDVTKLEYRYYDSSKQLLFLFDEAELTGITLYDVFAYEDKLGGMISKDGIVKLVVWNNDKDFLYEYDLKITFAEFDNNSLFRNVGEVHMLSNGFFIEHYAVECLPLGFSSSRGCNYYDVNFKYYDFPYLIKTQTDGNGFIETIDSSISGEEVVFTITPKEGFVLGVVKVIDSDGNVVTFTDYKFTMPSADVKIEATFIPENPDTADFVIVIAVSCLILGCLWFILSFNKMKVLK